MDIDESGICFILCCVLQIFSLTRVDTTATKWYLLFEFLKSGAWRSLVAHLSGGQVVAGSNPAVPTRW